MRPEFPELRGPMSRWPAFNAREAGGFLNWSLTQARDLLPAKMEEEPGLKLEPARAPVEVLVIERAEKTGENCNRADGPMEFLQNT
jgi:hypothetical protein